MSRSVHTSRPKFRKAFRYDYSTDEERMRVLGKILEEGMLKKSMKANARLKKQSLENGLKHSKVFFEQRSAASKKSLPAVWAIELAKRNSKKGYG